MAASERKHTTEDTEQRFVSVDDLVTEIQKHLLKRGAPGLDDLNTLLDHFRARRMGLKEFCSKVSHCA